MKRAWHILGRPLVVLAVLLAGFVAVEHFRGELALNARLKKLRAQGEKLSVADLEPKRATVGSNAAVELLKLADRLKSALTNSFLDNPAPAGRFAAPGHVIVGWQLTEWPDYDNKFTNNWARVGAILEANQDLTQALHAALQVPQFDSGFDYRKGLLDFKLDGLVTTKRAAQYLSVSTGSELSAGRHAAVVEHLAAMLRFVQHQHDERLIISQLVRIACGTLAWEATWQALQSPGWSDNELASLQQGWQSVDYGADMAVSFEMERTMTLDLFRQIRESTAAGEKYFGQYQSAVEFWGREESALEQTGFVLRWIRIPLWRLCWASQDELHSLNEWQYIIESDRLARSNSWAEAKIGWSGLKEEPFGIPLAALFGNKLGGKKPSIYNRWRYLISIDPTAVDGNMILKVLRAEIQRRMLVTVLALERHRLRYGKLPDSLQALVPEFLPAVPVDGMDGKPLHYRLKPDGMFVLYSVGENCVDDGGDPSLLPGKETVRFWDGLDAVWPTPASAEETARTMEKAKKK